MKNLIPILIFTFSFSTIAQEKISFADLDASTFKLYEESEWEELIKLGNEGLDLGFDYYYLRLRIGIACYNLDRFDDASDHFKKSLEFNTADPISLEYLYYSLLLSGSPREAKLVSAEMPEATRRKIGAPALYGINGMFFEGGQVAVTGLDTILAYQPEGSRVDHYLLKNYTYLAGGLNISLGKRLTSTIAINRMNFNGLQELTLSSQFGRQTYDSVFQNSQSGFYLGGEWTLQPDWYLGFAGHFIQGDYSYMNYRPAPMGMDQFSYENLSYSDFVIEGSINHRFSKVLTGFILSYNELGNKKGLQPGLELTWYPKGNLNLYVITQIDRLVPLEESRDGTWVFQGRAGMKVLSRLWLEAHAAGGRMAGWTEKSAYIVYNNQDPILYRTGFNLILPDIFKGFSLSFRYQLQQRQHSWEINTGNNQPDRETKEYLTNSIIGGIAWKF